MENKVKQLAKKYYETVTEIRHILHANPEISEQEYETQKIIESILDGLKIPHQRMGNTGVVGLIEGGLPGKTVLLRGDMDALPIQEEVDVPFKSKVDGLMHACGHDGHVAGLLGAAMILQELRGSLKGNVKLMFQPAEETVGGADRMIKEGILENPTVDAAFSLHLWGDTAEDVINVKRGPMMGAPDEFTFTVRGRGAHASMPQQGVNPVIILAQVISAMQAIIPHHVDPFDPIVLTFTQLTSGSASNIIPETATAAGTMRTMHPDTRKAIPKKMEQLLASICEATGATYEFSFVESFPPLLNDNDLTELVRKATGKIVGPENVIDLETPSLGGDDFAYLGYEIPSCYYYYGIADPNDLANHPVHHHPKFAWRDEILEGSMASLAQVAIDYLNETE